MWQIKDEMKCENVKWKMENVIIWGRFWVHHEADENAVNSCKLIPTHYIYDKNKIKTSWADRGLLLLDSILFDQRQMKDMEWIMNEKQVGSKFQGVSLVERR